MQEDAGTELIIGIKEHTTDVMRCLFGCCCLDEQDAAGLLLWNGRCLAPDLPCMLSDFHVQVRFCDASSPDPYSLLLNSSLTLKIFNKRLSETPSDLMSS